MPPSANNNIEKDIYFRYLFDNYWKKVYQICYHYTKDSAVSKDLTQNIFLSLWEKDLRTDNEEYIEKYLSRAAKYQVLNHFRNNKKIELTDSFPEAATSSQNNTQSRILYKEMFQHLQEQIDALNEPARTIFKLSREKEMSYKEISIQTGLSIKTVEFHISKVLKQLRKHFNVTEK